MHALPRLLIAGVSSGVGKTTFTLGLCRALMRRGLRVSVFKCGPDYLDPTYHRAASQRPVHNLDSWLMNAASLRATFVRNAADVSLIEGVMGLFDGASSTELTGSSAEIAGLLGAPIVLVCDASGMARSVAALAHGFASFDADTRVRGLICNRVGSAGHLALLKQACTQVPVLGGLTKNQALRFPERHLGLHTADQLDLEPTLEAWADRVDAECDVDALLACAREATPLPSVPAPTATATATRCRIGVAHDEAFHFYYDENLRLLEQAGAEIVRFSPLHDAVFPDLDGAYIGGGYPELYAQQLASNQVIIAGLRRLARAHKPIYAECGGLMYLSDAIVTQGAHEHAMVGLIDGKAIMCDRLQALGYVEVQTSQQSPLGPAGTTFRGHQFRYSRWDGQAPSRYQMRIKRTGASLTEGYGQQNVLASYVHAHWASNPSIANAFVAACAERN